MVVKNPHCEYCLLVRTRRGVRQIGWKGQRLIMFKKRDLRFRRGVQKFVLATSAAVFIAGAASAEPITTELNGQRLNFDQPPVMQQGRIMVPLRGIFESLGADVIYEPAQRRIKATDSQRTVELTLGQKQAFVDGRQVYLDVPADTLEGRTMVPLRFVSEALGADVKWLSAGRIVAITHNNSVGAIQPSAEQPIALRPVIDQLVHNGRTNLRQGDTLTVTVLGAPSSQASFSILGAVNDVGMTEVSPGRYEGQLRITPGMQVTNGTVVARLEKGGMESLKEAERTVTIASANASNNVSQATYLQPSPGASVSQTRPLVSAQFSEMVRPGTASLRINGVHFTPSLGNDSRTLTFVPTHDLGAGLQQVEAQALTQDGRLQTMNWNFAVDTQTASQVQQPTVSVSNLQDGSTVPPVFSIQGQTTPYTKVQIDATSQRALIPGIIGIQGRSVQTSTVSDGNGRFQVQLNTSAIPSESRLDVEVSVMGDDGRVTDSVDLNLIRE